MDNAPYHRTEVDKLYAKLPQQMINWQDRHGVQCDTSMKKAMLYTIINLVKPKENTFRVVKLLENHGRSVVKFAG
jgi:hypothetical protein